jgi:hypothetical protein
MKVVVYEDLVDRIQNLWCSEIYLFGYNLVPYRL